MPLQDHGEVARGALAPLVAIEAPRNGLHWDPEFHFDRATHCATRKGPTPIAFGNPADARFPLPPNTLMVIRYRRADGAEPK